MEAEGFSGAKLDLAQTKDNRLLSQVEEEVGGGGHKEELEKSPAHHPMPSCHALTLQGEAEAVQATAASSKGLAIPPCTREGQEKGGPEGQEAGGYQGPGPRPRPHLLPPHTEDEKGASNLAPAPYIGKYIGKTPCRTLPRTTVPLTPTTWSQSERRCSTCSRPVLLSSS